VISLLWETTKIAGTRNDGLPLSPKRQWRSPAMATQNTPNDPYDRDHLKDPTRTYIDDRRSPAELDNDLQPDLEMAEGPASNTRIALFAVGIAVILGIVFYGLNNTSLHQQASTAPPANSQKSASTSPPAAPSGMRDVTPRPNTQPGTTTGAAPANPQTPSPAPGGANANNANPGNAPASK
jgi:hypothetical protein